MSGRTYAYYVSLAAGGILAAGLIFYFTIGKEIFTIPACIIYESTGFYCPACGGTRSLEALFRGKILLSLRYHSVVLYSIAVWILFVVTETTARLFSGAGRLSDKFWKNSIYTGLFLLLGHAILRNILKF